MSQHFVQHFDLNVGWCWMMLDEILFEFRLWKTLATFLKSNLQNNYFSNHILIQIFLYRKSTSHFEYFSSYCSFTSILWLLVSIWMLGLAPRAYLTKYSILLPFSLLLDHLHDIVDIFDVASTSIKISLLQRQRGVDYWTNNFWRKWRVRAYDPNIIKIIQKYFPVNRVEGIRCINNEIASFLLD